MQNKNALTPGTLLQQYRIEKIIGQGGFGITYLATDLDLNRKVAIKECYPRDFVARDGTTVVPTSAQETKDYDWALRRFLEEATTLACFKNNGIVQVLQILKDTNNTAYMVLEFVEGQSLDQWLKGLGCPPSQKDLLDLCASLLPALDLVHKNNYTHRDIAPDNIYIRQNGSAVLLDFGAAKHLIGQQSKSLNLIVKNGYSPHEQYYAEGRQGPWTDIYAFAATLYRAITGEKPVDAAARQGAITNDQPDPLVPLLRLNPEGYDQDFLAAIDAGLQIFIKNRPQSVPAWQAMLNGHSQPITPASAPLQNAPAAGTYAYKPDEKAIFSGVSATPSSMSSSHQQPKDPKPTKPYGKWALIGLAAAGFVGLSGFLISSYLETNRQNQQVAAWENAQNQDTEAALRSFLVAYPESPFANEAKTGIERFSAPFTVQFSGQGLAAANSLVASTSGTLYVAGQTAASPHGATDGYLLSLSGAGKARFEKIFPAEELNNISSVLELTDSSLIVLGTEGASPRTTEQTGKIIRLSAAGDILWQKSLAASKTVYHAMSLTPQGDIALAGTSYAKSRGQEDGAVALMSPDGTMKWQKTFGNSGFDQFNDIVSRKDGQFVVAGTSYVNPQLGENFWLLKLSSTGEKLDERITGGTKEDVLRALTLLDNDDVVAVGYTKSFSQTHYDGFLLVYSDTNRFPPKPFIRQANEQFLDSVASGASTVRITGRKDGTTRGSSQILVIEYDVLRQTINWERVINTGGTAQGTSMITLGDGSAVVSATHVDGSSPQMGKAVVLKIRQDQ